MFNQLFKERNDFIQQIMKNLFDIVYLITVVSLGIIMIRKSKGVKEYLLFGIIAIVLGLGDSFHLVPRMIALCTTGYKDYLVPLELVNLLHLLQ